MISILMEDDCAGPVSVRLLDSSGGGDFLAALVASCFLGALPPVGWINIFTEGVCKV